MANEEHVALLLKSVKEWNEWRSEKPETRPDLAGVNLRRPALEGANLREADLRGAGLLEAYLLEADLRGADLEEAHLWKADLGMADLWEANLRGAFLGEAHLWEADLRGADLRRAYLGEADLKGADLREANLWNADLGTADLRGADLRGADLRRADLGGAYLNEADLGGAKLRGAALELADLREADFGGADLRGADFGKASLGDTILANVDLCKVKGLDSCRHSGPSVIDHRTLQYGPLPTEFLRGCGLSDWEIEAAKLHQANLTLEQITDITYKINELRGHAPIQFQSCFISYSTGDEHLATRLHADLQDNGVRCWFAPEDLKIGEKFRARIDEAIFVHDRLLLILSARSLASDWVEKEVETALEKEREEKRLALFPIRVDDAVMKSKFGWAADIRRGRHIGDFTNWEDDEAYQKGFARLLRDLRAEDEREAASHA